MIAALTFAGCGSSDTATTTHRPAAASRVVALPANLLMATAPQANGTLWTLAGDAHAREIAEFALPSGATQTTVGVSNTATAIAQSSSGELALGLGAARSGAVELLNGSTGAAETTIPVGAPVRDLMFGADGVTLSVLDATPASASVSVLDTQTRRVVKSVGVSLGADSIVPSPGGDAVWVLTTAGSVEKISLQTGRPLTSFLVGGRGIGIAISSDGTTLYVLKGTTSPNIAVIDAATGAVSRVLPAAAHSVGLSVSLNDDQLYNFVGAPTYGNVQILDL